MPRKARIDATGAIHHIIIRGIERKKIFRNDSDRENFIERLGKIVTEAGRNPNSVLWLEPDSGPCALVTANRFGSHIDGYAPAFDRLCGIV